ncbi:MAG: PP2C family protein-serine/threonine phosphatase [Planctomycetota bacterium]
MDFDYALGMRATPEVESRFWVGCCEATTDTQDAGPGRAAVFTAASPLHPTRNEDGAAVFSLGDCAVIAVADGVGGLPGGDAAAAHALEALGSSLDEVRDTPDSRRVRDALLDGFELGHARIRDTDCGATTLACVELRPDSFRTYHAGDSAVLVIDRVGMIKQQTVPHSPVGYAMESGLIDEDEALFHPKRNVIFKCLGREHMGLELDLQVPGTGAHGPRAEHAFPTGARGHGPGRQRRAARQPDPGRDRRRAA